MLFQERKIIAAAAKLSLSLLTHKTVDTLGNFPLPIEAVRYGYEMTVKHIRELGGSRSCGKRMGPIILTDNENYIIDSSFQKLRTQKS